MRLPCKLSYFFVAVLGVAMVPAWPALAGFEWVAPPQSRAAPVDDVETSVLPPQPGVAGQEVGIQVIPSDVAGNRDRGTGVSSVPAHVPRRVPAPVAPSASVSGVAPVVNEAPAVVAALPTSVYPPPGNMPARPLGVAPHMITWEGSASAVAHRPLSKPDGTVGRSVPIVEPAPDMTPTIQVKAPVAPSVAPTLSVATSAPRAVVDGFGTAVPLSLALDQIVPDGWSIEDQVHLDPNMIVSWAGGRPWDKVLEDMLYAHGVRVSVTGSTVVLFRLGGAPAPLASGAPVVSPGSAAVVPVPSVVVSPVASVPVRPAPLPSVAPTPSMPERVVADVSVVPAAPPGTGPAVGVAQSPVSVPASVPAPVSMSASGRFESGAVDLFSGRTGETVETVLNRWGRIAHVGIRWNVGQDVSLPQSFAVNATFTRAVERLLDVYRGQAVRPVATLETDPASGGAILVVNRAGM